MPGLLGKKIGMTSVFSAEGKNVPCTVIEAGPCVVTQVKSVEKDGYAAVQLGFQEAKAKNTTKPMEGHFKKAGTAPKRHLAEFTDFDKELNLGDIVTVDVFEGANFVDVTGTSKGHGFQGVVTRHGLGVSVRLPTARTTVSENQVLSVPALILQRCSKVCAWAVKWATSALLHTICRYLKLFLRATSC